MGVADVATAVLVSFGPLPSILGGDRVSCRPGVLWVDAVGGNLGIVRVRDSITLSERSAPQPDVALLRWRDDFYGEALPGPSDVRLVVEVAEASAETDRDKPWPTAALVSARRGSSTVEVAENLLLDNGKPTFGPLKTRLSHRRVPLPRQTIAALEEHCDTFGVGRDDLLFTSVQRQLLRAYQFRRRHFHPAAAAAELSPLRPHDLRHTAISLWIASGANPKVVQTKAGHASIKVTYDRYGHLFPDYDDRRTRHLEDLWAKLPSEQRGTLSVVK
jgi:hypothetical protein